MGAAPSKHAALLDAVARRDTRRLADIFRDPAISPLLLAKPLSDADLAIIYPTPPKPFEHRPAWSGTSPLHVAAAGPDLRLLRELVRLLASTSDTRVEAPDAVFEPAAVWSVRDAAGLTPLSCAVRANRRHAVAVLADAGANLDEPHSARDADASNPACWSHVRYAAVTGLADALDALLDAGADCASWARDGRRPVHLAVEAGKLESVQALLRRDIEHLSRLAAPDANVPAADPTSAPAHGHDDNSAHQKRVRAVGKYIVRECNFPVPDDPAHAGSAAADDGSPLVSTATPPATSPADPGRHIFNALQSALQDAVREVTTAARTAYRSNRDRGAGLLHLACAHSHPHVLQYLLSLDEFSTAIEEKNDSGKSAIFMAIRHGSLACLKLLVSRGARIDTRDIENWTALHEAVKAGNDRTQILDYLVHNSAIDVNVVDDDGWTPLHVAARFSATNAVDILVNAGADIDALTEDNETPVLLASAQPSSAEVLRKLLAHGADLSVHRDTALTPSRLILGRKDFEQLCILLDHLKTLDEKTRREVVDFESRSETGDTLLHLCVMERNAQATQRLLAVGAKPDEKNHEGVAPLHTACKGDSADIVRVLLKAGADPDVVRGDGMMPVHLAADNGHVDAVEALIEYGCDVNRTVSHAGQGRFRGFTPLMFAARLGNEGIILLLLNAGAEIDCMKGDGFTALHLAALNGNTTATRVLIESGADYRLPDENGYLPLQLATRHNQFDVVSTLLEAKVEADSCGNLGLTSLHIAAFVCDTRMIWLLLRGGADVNGVNSDNTTPLHIAAGREQGRVTMQLLLANGAKIDVLDSEEDTPLHNACYKGLYQNARLLLRRGAKPSPVNESGVTPLHLAAAMGSEETVEALLKYGADVEARDGNRMTPYRVASEHGHRKAMILLFRSMKVSLQDLAPTKTFERGNPESSADDVLCVICQTSLTGGDATRALPCGHTYHDECILAWLGGEDLLRHDSCPLCQKSVLPESTSPRRLSSLSAISQ